MKTLIALALAMSGAAFAQTITLFPAGGAGALHQYYSIPTSAVPDDPVSFNVGTQTYLSFESEAGNSLYGEDNWHWTGPIGSPTLLQRWHCYGPLINRGGYYSQDCVLTGEVLTLSYTESSRLIKGSGSGRGGYAPHRVWTFNGGTITRQGS